jgi:hypothetical protein
MNMKASELLNSDPKLFARTIRRRRRGMNVAFRLPDGRLDCRSFAELERATAFAAKVGGRLV